MMGCVPVPTKAALAVADVRGTGKAAQQMRWRGREEGVQATCGSTNFKPSVSKSKQEIFESKAFRCAGLQRDGSGSPPR